MKNLNRRAFLRRAALASIAGIAHQHASAIAWQSTANAGSDNAYLLAGYTNETSVYPGEVITFHIGDHRKTRDDAPLECSITIRKRRSDLSFSMGDQLIVFKALPPNVSETGCDWPGIPFTVPDDWESGIYTAEVTGGEATALIPFIVKKRRSTVSAEKSILVVIPFATHLAYNAWPGPENGGRSLYAGEPVGTRLHTHRPGLLSPDPNDYDDLLIWLNSTEFGADVSFGTSFDLQFDPDYVRRHNLVVPAWHDEYWSTQMRQTAERFIADGGNFCFMSGNTCWWKVLLEKDPATGAIVLTCRKDPATEYWHRIGKPESKLVGISSLEGAVWAQDKVSKPALPYLANYPGHWLYSGTTLEAGAPFGMFSYPNESTVKSVVGYETDAKDRFSPPNWVTLAYTDNLIAPGPHSCQSVDTWVPLNPVNNCGAAKATGNLGFYRRNGMVVAIGSIDWKSGLGFEATVSRMTWNLFDRLRCSNSKANLDLAHPARRLPNLSFEDWEMHTNVPTGWEKQGLGTCRRVERAYGSTALEINAARGDTVVSLSGISLALDCRYRLGAWVKLVEVGARLPSLVLESPGASGSNTAVVHIYHPAKLGKWTYITDVGHAPGIANARVAGSIKIVVPAGATLLIDDIRPENMNAEDKPWASAIPVTNKNFDQTWENDVPRGWYKEGPGRAGIGAHYLGGPSLYVGGSNGAAWVSQRLEAIERRAWYRIGAWVHSNRRGTFLQLQSMQIVRENRAGLVFASTEHPGDGTWRYLTAVGRPSVDEGELFHPRALLLANGADAHFKEVTIDIVGACDDAGNTL